MFVTVAPNISAATAPVITPCVIFINNMSLTKTGVYGTNYKLRF